MIDIYKRSFGKTPIPVLKKTQIGVFFLFMRVMRRSSSLLENAGASSGVIDSRPWNALITRKTGESCEACFP